MGLIKWLADSISENLNLKTDLELEQEYLHLQEKYNELDSLYESMHERLITSSDNFEKLAKENKSLVTENDRLIKNKDELSNALKDKPQSQFEKQNISLKKINKKLLDVVETYEYLGVKENQKTAKEVFSHNVNVYLSDNNMKYIDLADKVKMNRKTMGAIVAGNRGATTNTIPLLEVELCSHFKRSLLELVSVKMEETIVSTK